MSTPPPPPPPGGTPVPPPPPQDPTRQYPAQPQYPPQYQQPQYQQPQPQYPPQYQQQYATMPPTGGPPTPKGRNGLMLAVVGVVAAAVGVGAFVLLRDDGDESASRSTTSESGPDSSSDNTTGSSSDSTDVATTTGQSSAFATDEAFAKWQLLVDGAGLSDDPSFTTFSACPFGELDDLVALAPPDVQEVGEAAAAGDDTFEMFLPQFDGEQPVVQCLRYDSDSDTQVGLLLTERIDLEFREELEMLLDNFVIEYGTEQPYLGGTIAPYCADPIGVDNGLAFCEADWYDDDILVGVFVTSPDGQAGEDATEWLMAVLPVLVGNFAVVDPNDIS